MENIDVKKKKKKKLRMSLQVDNNNSGEYSGNEENEFCLTNAVPGLNEYMYKYMLNTLK